MGVSENPVSAQLPAPSPELVLWRVSVEAFLSAASRRRAERFLRLMADRLATEEGLASVFPIRPDSDRAALQQARREAVALFEKLLPVFLASLPPE